MTFGRTLGTAPQLASNVGEDIRVHVDGHDISVLFNPVPSGGQVYMPKTCVVQLTFADTGVPSRRAAFAVLVRAAQDVLDVIRVTQPATGLAGALPSFERVNFRQNGKEQPLGFDWYLDHRPVAMILHAEDTQPHADDFRRLLLGEVNEDWDLDILISQARHYAQNNWDSNPALALFQAALVMETKMKRVLWRDTPGPLQASLQLIVPKKSSMKHDVLSLFSSIAQAFLDRSLKVERVALWDETRSVFDRRNEFAHQAKPVSHHEAERAVRCARRVGLWADNGAAQNYRH